jgi:hypothetical protein
MFRSWFTVARTARKPRQGPDRAFRPTLEGLEDRITPTSGPLIFNVDPTQSSLTLSGNLSGLVSAPLTQQASGSLVTTYSGPLVTEYDPDPLGPSIQFVAADAGSTTAVAAANSGSWQPLRGGGSGSEPANYGAQANLGILFGTAYAAVRDFVSKITTDTALALDGSGNFSSAVRFTATAGQADYHSNLGSGTFSLTNQSANNNASGSGSFVDLGGGSLKITLPVHYTITQTFTVSGQTVTATLTTDGALVARADRPVVDPSSSDPATFTAGGNPVVVADVVNISSNSANQNLTQALVTLTNMPDGSAESLAVTADLTGTGLTASYDSTTGILTISGTANFTTYQNVLQSIVYSNSAVSDTSDRAITFVVSDGVNTSLQGNWTVSVTT